MVSSAFPPHRSMPQHNAGIVTAGRSNLLPYTFTCILYIYFVLKYPSFNLLNDTEKAIFLFNNADSFICKKLGYFIYEALNIKETYNLI